VKPGKVTVDHIGRDHPTRASGVPGMAGMAKGLKGGSGYTG